VGCTYSIFLQIDRIRYAAEFVAPHGMLTDVGPVEIEVPRDRDGSFEPGIVRKRRLAGVDLW
jgi:hypothetical protein